MVITNNNIEMTSWWLPITTWWLITNNNIEMTITLKWRHNMVITNNNIEMTSQHGDYK